MNRQGGQQHLRYPGYAQQPLQNRAPNPGTSRLQNASKMGNGTGAGWGFPTNGIAGLGAQQRQAGPSSFAQTIGGNSSGAPLDMSEFPSLSGGNTQSQFPNTNNPIWQRQSQQTPVQRAPQPSHSANPQQQHSSNPQHPGSPSNEDMFIGSSHLQGSLDDYHQSSQIPRQPPGQGIDEFPPLGRNGTDEHNDQGRAFGFPSQSSFPQDSSSRANLLNTFNHAADSTRSSSAVDRTMSPSSNRTAQTPTNNFTSLLQNLNTSRNVSSGSQPQPGGQEFDGRIPDQKMEEMSDADRLGLAGFLHRLKSDNPMDQLMARGIDPTTLGLDLNSSEPVWKTWSGAFNDNNTRPPIPPDFHLPDCYTVKNVHPVPSKIPSFSDDTLFWIFYNQPRDIAQGLAAQELTNRNWRYHKTMKIWLTKDPSLPEPMRLTDEAEKGTYVYWDIRAWEKRRWQDLELNYRDLAPVGSSRVNGASA